MQEPARRWCREAYFSTQQPQTSTEARLSCPRRHSRRPLRAPFSPGKGPASSECVITSIARRRTFAELRRDGRKARSGSVRLSFLPLESENPQVAFAIGRSFGNAVERNRGRRRLRAAFIEAACPRSATNRKSTDSVENTGSDCGSFADSGADNSGHHQRSHSGDLDGLQGAFLLSGNRGLLSSPFTNLVRDVDKCLEKLKTMVVS